MCFLQSQSQTQKKSSREAQICVQQQQQPKMLSSKCFGFHQLVNASQHVMSKHLRSTEWTMHRADIMYCNVVSSYFSQSNILAIILVNDIMVVNQHDSFCLIEIIHIYRIMIVTHAINNSLIHKFKQIQSHVLYKLNETGNIVHILNKTVIFVLLIISYDTFDTNWYKTDIFHLISNKVDNLGVIKCIINSNNTIVYFIDTLDVIIKSSVKYFYIFMVRYISANANVMLMIVSY